MRSHSKALFAVAALFAFLVLAPIAQAAPKKVIDVFGQTSNRSTEAGEFWLPGDAAVNQTSGDVYVIDAAELGDGGQRIQQFTADGEFIRVWGWGVATGADAFEICATSCQGGVLGSGEGQLSIDITGNRPSQIAIDQSDGSLYVADTGNDRVQKFSAEGAYLDQFGTSGSGAGELSQPQGVAVDPVSGDVYVSDTNNNRIQRFTSDGNFISAMGLDVVQPGGVGEQFVLHDELQALFVGPAGEGEITGGTFILSFEGETTADIAFDASAAAIQAALEALPAIGTGNVEVSGPSGGLFEIHFAGALAETDVSDISGDGSNLTGDLPSGASVEAFTTQQGGQFPTFEICTVAAECQAGTEGSGPGELRGPGQIEVDSTGRLYVVDMGNERVQRYSPSGAFDEVFAEGQISAPQQIVVDPADDHVYVGTQSDVFQTGILELDGAGALVEVHAADLKANFLGLAIRSSNRHLYASGIFYFDGQGDSTAEFGVAILDEVTDPTVSIEPVTDIGGNEATFNGTVNPQGGPPETRYRFEYSTDGVKWSQAPVVDAPIGEGTADIAVSQTPTNLEADTEYRVRLVAVKDFGSGSATSSEVTFTTTNAPPKVEALWPGPVSATTAWLGGRVNPQNAASTYYVEYSTENDPGFANSTSVPVSENASAGSGNSPHFAVEQVKGLQPDTTYHYRVVAENVAGTTTGESRSFETLADVPSQGLPDGRVSEKVSPSFKGGAGIKPSSNPHPIYGYRAQAALDGSAVAFGSNGKFGGDGGSIGSQYLARRGPDGGWSTEGINPRIPPAAGVGDGMNLYQWFSEDLRYGIVRSEGQLTPGDPFGVWNLYRRDNLTGEIERLSPGGPGTLEDTRFNLLAAVGDGSQAVMHGYEVRVEGEQEGSTYEHLPSGDTQALPEDAFLGSHGYARFGWPDGREIGPNAVSSDGSRTFFHISAKSGSNGDLFRVEDGQAAVHVSASERSGGNPDKTTDALFQGASTDGSVAYFTSAEALTDSSNPAPKCGGALPGDPGFANCETLYRWDGDAPAGERLTDLTDQDPQGVHVLGVTSISDDGDSVYFVSVGDLTESGNRSGGLYLWREGEGARLIARVSRVREVSGSAASELWSPEFSNGVYREARVTPDGRYLAFSSRDSLTAYETNGTAQIYLYDSETGRITCMSCGSVEPESTQGSWFLACIGDNANKGEPADCRGKIGLSTEYLVRNLRADGKRFVFDSKEALVPEDTNGAIDVYQWQEGSLHLLSSGTSAFPSKLMDASASLDDVFFTTTQQLTRSDQDDLRDLYDARVGGVPEPDVTPPCVADECQGAPKPPPTFQTPASSGTQGPGNLQEGRPRCAKGKVRRKGRCVRKARKASKRQNSRKANKTRRAGR